MVLTSFAVHPHILLNGVCRVWNQGDGRCKVITMAPKAVQSETPGVTVAGSLSSSADEIELQPLETQTQLEQSREEKKERQAQPGGGSTRQSQLNGTGSLDDTKQFWP